VRHLEGASHELAPALPANIRLGWRAIVKSKTLKLTCAKNIYNIGPWPWLKVSQIYVSKAGAYLSRSPNEILFYG
jgi:hypothetical protein